MMTDDILTALTETYRTATAPLEPLPEDVRPRFLELRDLLSELPTPETTGPHLLLRTPDDAPRWIPLRGELRIGRHRDNELAINRSWMSSFHCRVICDEGQWMLEDLDSTNGTSVNGRRVSRHMLCQGDTIHLGEVQATYLQVESEGAPDMQ